MSIFELSEHAVDEVAAINPLMATYSGIVGYNHLWPDLSPDGSAARQQYYVSLRQRAIDCALDSGSAEPSRAVELATRVLIDDCNLHVANADAPFFDLNNIASSHQELRFVFGSQPAETGQDWDAILTRLETIDQPLAGYQATLDQGLAKGHVVSQRQVTAVIDQGRSTASENSSFHELTRRLNNSPLADDPTIDHLRDRLSSAITHAQKSFQAFNDYLESTYLPSADEADAVGSERYVQQAQQFLGAKLDPHSTYRWGWDEVERLWADMQRACAQIDASASPAEVIHQLQTDPMYAAADQVDFINRMKEIQQQALSQLAGKHFDVPDQIRAIDVQVEPAGGALAAHYVGPSEDFTRPGSVWYPVDGQQHFPLFREVTIAYHEGFPGHHLQVGVQNTLAESLSRYHRTMVWYPGSGEGWALYAEGLMKELGYFDRPEYEIGLLSSQLLRSARIAIDIGSHLELPIPKDVSFHPGERWSYELAVELLTDRALESIESANSEVLRYYGWPGQAISYKVGEQAILDLRATHQRRPDFDMKTFHSDVLSVGSIGLDLMQEFLAPQPQPE